jgi:hypothetical protein
LYPVSTLFGVLDTLLSAGDLTSALQETLHADVLALRGQPWRNAPKITMDELREKATRAGTKSAPAADDAGQGVPMDHSKDEVLSIVLELRLKLLCK